LLVILPLSFVNDNGITATQTFLLASQNITFEPIIHTGMFMIDKLDISTIDARKIIVFLNPSSSEMHIYAP
jgi:hypothetical protein